jgi:hypothetical protein
MAKVKLQKCAEKISVPTNFLGLSKTVTFSPKTFDPRVIFIAILMLVYGADLTTPNVNKNNNNDEFHSNNRCSRIDLPYMTIIDI